MTPQEVAALSDQDMDDLLGAKGMEWGHHGIWSAESRGWYEEDGRSTPFATATWSPSTDLNHVAMVTEKLRGRGWRIDVVCPSMGWGITLYRDGYVGQALHPSRARAEAEACLLALESEGAK